MILDSGSIGEAIRLYLARKIPNGWFIALVIEKRTDSAQGIDGPLRRSSSMWWVLILESGSVGEMIRLYLARKIPNGWSIAPW